jgi:hypothetical protein
VADQYQKLDADAAKTAQDTFKHMTTLCTGAVVLTATVVGAFFRELNEIWTLWLSIVFLLSAMAAAMLGLYGVTLNLLGDWTNAVTRCVLRG